MKRPHFASLVFCTVFVVSLLAGCNKGSETLAPAQDFSSFTNFDKLRIGSGFRTTVRQGATRQVLVAVPSSDQANLRVEQSNATLSIEIVNKSSQIAGTVDITMPTLTTADFSGGVAGTISGFAPNALTIGQTGGSSVTLTGSAQTLMLTLSGGSTFNGYAFPTADATVDLSGGSQARVAATTTLNVAASGGSKLFYKGAPTLTQNLSGASTVTKE